jgi:hypothetical protein
MLDIMRLKPRFSLRIAIKFVAMRTKERVKSRQLIRSNKHLICRFPNKARYVHPSEALPRQSQLHDHVQTALQFCYFGGVVASPDGAVFLAAGEEAAGEEEGPPCWLALFPKSVL